MGSDEKKLKILVAGGGIGGLVFGLAAKRSGFDVKVFEKDLTAVRGEGMERGPIQLLSSALSLLEGIDKDVAREIMGAGHVTGDRNCGLADGRSGDWFVKFDFLTPAIAKGIPITLMICRMELQRLLLNAVGEDVVINNSKVVDFVTDANKVTVFLDNGQQYEGDILVGADGLRSTVRSKLFGGEEPKYSNFICYTGVAEFDPQHLPHFGYKVFLGRNQFLVAADIGKGRLQWYAFIKEARESPVSSTGNKNMLVQRYRDWCDEVVTVIRKTPEHTIMRRPICDTDMIKTWGRDRVILVGDAAHAMLPNLGQGGSMAIEDCYWLMVELQNLAQTHPVSEISSDELALAFRRFEKKRMFRVRTLHSICRMASVTTSFYRTYLDIGALPPDKDHNIITMIYVGGVPFAPDDSSQGMDTLIALMEHPVLVSSSNSFKSMAEKRVSVSGNSSSVGPETSKWVYIFQREFATVDPALVDLVGTDEATTCVGIAIRNCKTGMISVAHMDSPKVVDTGLNQMLSLVADHESDALLDVHLIGGFDDISSQHPYLAIRSRKMEGYSYPLCVKIIETLRNRSEKFQIQTLHVLGHNTKWDSEGIAYPIFHGFVMETSSGSIIPASFDGTSRCPDEIVRRIRVTAAFEDPSWSGKLLDTYDTRTDRFVIAPCVWTIRQKHIALTLQNLSDTEILLSCSSSPYAEVPDFVDNEKRKWDYLIRHPNWREAFPSKQPRVFQRTPDGTWIKQ
ncbi:protein N-terminal asparagine amidohydrolase [Sesamum alatum]|uniref:Protein N-terminal asparagine amidohydrolase n=1 Tax=Sesamum alatum TaxID=300844 RepID=A0AAE1XM45_9LAMI|nr:protein N-terminal asparagine amidohydrolase [Sesamum alatum]